LISLSNNKNKHFYLLRDYLAYMISKVIPGFAGFFSIILFFNLLGPAEFGRYSLIFSFINMCSAFSFGWLSQSMIRYFYKIKMNNKISIVIFNGIIFSSFICLILLGSFHFFEFPFQSNFKLLIILAISLGGFSVSVAFFQSNQMPGMVVKLSGIQAILSIAIPFLIIKINGPFYISMLTGLIVAYSLPFIYVFISSSIKSKNWRFKFSFQTLKPLIQFGFPLSFWFVVSFSLRFLERFSIEHFLGLEMMGSYAGYVEVFTRIFSIFLFPLTLAVHPRIMNLWNKNKFKETIALLKISLIVQASILGLLILLFTSFKQLIFGLFLKLVPQLDPAMEVILIPVLLGGFIWQYALLIHKPLELKEKSGLMLLFIIISAIITIFGNFIFLPKYGIIATAYTTIVSGGMYLFLTTIASRKFWLQK